MGKFRVNFSSSEAGAPANELVGCQKSRSFPNDLIAETLKVSEKFPFIEIVVTAFEKSSGHVRRAPTEQS
jgi:hypothetical protein